METPIEKAIRELKAAEDELGFIKAAFEVERAKRRELEVQVDNLIAENYFLHKKLGPQAPTFSPCKRCIRLFAESHIPPPLRHVFMGGAAKKMKVLELFAGTRSIGKAFEAKGHEVFSVEWDKRFENIDLYADIMTVTAEDILRKFGKPDVIWASPDCTTFSIAAISHHRRKNPVTGYLDPVSEYAKFCDAVDQHVLQLIRDLEPRFYFIENPRGGMRKMPWMQGLPRDTVTYCQYGDTRMKPTDIWTNHPNPRFKPICKNGDSCHERAPRSATLKKLKAQGIEVDVGGTQYGMKNSRDRSIIPQALCQHIVEICEEDRSSK